MSRVGAWCGIGAPVAFVGGWLLAGAQADGYSPVHEHISRLAQVGAPTRPLMTAGFVGFGLLAPAWGRVIGRSLGSRAVEASVTTAGVTTLAVAALPLGASFGDLPHSVAAGVGYVAMASSPLLAARHLGGLAGAASVAIGTTSAVLLAATTLGHASGLLQRAGLGAVDVWFAAMAVRELRRRPGCAPGLPEGPADDALI